MGEMLVFDVMYANEVCSHVEVNRVTGDVKCVDYTDIRHRQAFGHRPHTIENVNFFFKKRCFSEHRGDKDLILKGMGLLNFNPLDIVMRTRGVMCNDKVWIRFDGDDSTYEEVIKSGLREV